jgi:hypothetical protein
MASIEEQTMSRETLSAIYLDWKNNFLTISGFAEHYGLHDVEAEALIHLARMCFENPHPEA